MILAAIRNPDQVFDTPSPSLASELDVDDGAAARQCGHWEQFM